jgi:hypothetical protein
MPGVRHIPTRQRAHAEALVRDIQARTRLGQARFLVAFAQCGTWSVQRTRPGVSRQAVYVWLKAEPFKGRSKIRSTPWRKKRGGGRLGRTRGLARRRRLHGPQVLRCAAHLPAEGKAARCVSGAPRLDQQ